MAQFELHTKILGVRIEHRLNKAEESKLLIQFQIPKDVDSDLMEETTKVLQKAFQKYTLVNVWDLDKSKMYQLEDLLKRKNDPANGIAFFFQELDEGCFDTEEFNHIIEIGLKENLPVLEKLINAEITIQNMDSASDFDADILRQFFVEAINELKMQAAIAPNV